MSDKADGVAAPAGETELQPVKKEEESNEESTAKETGDAAKEAGDYAKESSDTAAKEKEEPTKEEEPASEEKKEEDDASEEKKEEKEASIAAPSKGKKDQAALLKSKEKAIKAMITPTDMELIFDSHLRMINFQMMCFSYVGIFCVMVYNDACFDRETLQFTDSFEGCPSALIFKLVAWAFYLVFLWRLIAYYTVQANRKRKLWGYSNKSAAFFRSELKWKFLLEMLVNACIPIPSIGDTGSVNNIITGLSFFRVYLLLRYLRDNSKIYRARFQIKHHFGKDFEIGSDTVFKFIFTEYTIISVFTILFVTLSFFAYMMWITERENWVNGDTGDLWVVYDEGGKLPPASEADSWYKGSYVDFADCSWFMIVTMTTLGYGDIYPDTWQGRVFAATAVVLGIIQTSLIVGVVTNTLTPTEYQDLVMSWLEHESLEKEIEYNAVKVIEMTFASKKKVKEKLARKNNKHKDDAAEYLKNVIRMNIRPWVKRLKHSKRKLTEIERKWGEGQDDKRVVEELQSTLDRCESRIDKLVDILSKK